MEYQIGEFPKSDLLFPQISKEQPKLTGSVFRGKLVPSAQELVIENISQAVLQAVKECIYGKTYN